MADVTRPLVVLTGASSGIGAAAALGFARLGWSVALVGRDPDRLAAATSAVRAAAGPEAHIASYRCDFAVLAQVRELGEQLLVAYPSIDVLANNAGGAYAQRRTTVDGHELTIQTNHLAPFLLSHLLRPALAGGRIVNTASAAHVQGRLDPDDLDKPDQRYTMFARYGSAKQANILFAAEAARRWPEITSTSYHPGVVRSRFGNERFVVSAFYRVWPWLRTPEKGAQTLLWLASTDSPVTNGGYYADEKPARPRSHAADPALAARLWAASLKATGLS
jgi:NAD(P)-dependent dehydrogenase (short-subunit alcohol dehydrogenase family)